MSNTGTRSVVLITGAAGFIGSALCHRLHSTGREVVGYDNLSRGRREFLPEGVPLIEGDIRDAVRVRETVATVRPDCVIHLAAMHFIPDCIARPQETIDVNVEGTLHVLDGCRNGSVRRIVFASSAAVYAPSDAPCQEETTSLRPLEVYGESKLAAERLISAFHRETGISTATLRLFNAIGRNETNPHVLPHVFESLRTSDVIPLGNVAPRRDYIDTRDVAAAIMAVADGPETSAVFNVGTGVAWSVQDLVDQLGRILGRTIRVQTEPSRMRTEERMLLVSDIEKIRHATSWTPRYQMQDTLEDLTAFYGLQTDPSSAPSSSSTSHGHGA